MPSPRLVSVVIRVRNEGPALRKVMTALAAQQSVPFETIVVDNESSDDSRTVAQESGAKILQISRQDFSYGKALNLGIGHSSGEFICILSAHAMPIGTRFLQSAIAPFEDATVAAVRCLSVTNRRDLETWINPSELVWPVEIEHVISAAPVNCASMIRRSVWEEIPYDETLTGVEDKFWAFNVLKKGHRISRSSATYLYLRDFTFRERVRKMYQDRLQYFRVTGRQWQEPPVRFMQLISNVFYTIPVRALRSAAYETILYGYLKLIPFQAKHSGQLVENIQAQDLKVTEK